MTYHHIAVMRSEIVQNLNCKPGQIIIDGTLGGGGHSEAICPLILPNGLLIGIDQDKDAIRNAQTKLRPFASNIRLFHRNFISIGDILEELEVDAVDGILLDLGLSLHHLRYSGRGFSFQGEEPLDMRMDVRADITARHIVNQANFKELRRIFTVYGEERRAPRIARQIINARQEGPIRTNRQLVDIVCKAMPSGCHRPKTDRKTRHPATKVFMALRIAVNQELEKLDVLMSTCGQFLKSGGRMCILSFHSLEDRIVKQHFKQLAKECICPKDFPICTCQHKASVRIITPKVLKPSEKEVQANPMARSAKMRVVEKL